MKVILEKKKIFYQKIEEVQKKFSQFLEIINFIGDLEWSKNWC